MAERKIKANNNSNGLPEGANFSKMNFPRWRLLNRLVLLCQAAMLILSDKKFHSITIYSLDLDHVRVNVFIQNAIQFVSTVVI